MRRYIGWLGDEPVATCQMVLGASSAGIYLLTTVARARGRGIGAAITAHPLLEARDEGYRVGVLQATEMGHPVYKRIGFSEQFRFHGYVAPQGA
ncbi:MAG TPA: hypothetical protein VF808_10235 [Ktedonobacterales bacterium]